MAFKFNPFSGTFDDVSKKKKKVESSTGTSTDNAIVRWDGTTGKLVQDSSLTISDAGDLIVTGDLTVNGTTTSVNSADLEVTDKNITVNNGGNDASAEGAGLTVERTGTDGSIVFEDALTSKWKLGLLGAEVEVADISSAQILTNKTIDADTNTITDIANANIAASAAIVTSKLEALTANRATITNGSGFLSVSAVTNLELAFVSGVTSSIQTQLDAKLDDVQLIDDDSFASATDTNINSAEATKAYVDSSVAAGVFNVNSISTNTTAAVNNTYLVDTSGGAVTVTLPAAGLNVFVRVKDVGSANTNNITIATPGAETIDGSASAIMDSNFESKTYVSDGTNWYIL